jgi:hypothetical protein
MSLEARLSCHVSSPDRARLLCAFDTLLDHEIKVSRGIIPVDTRVAPYR